MRYLSALCLSLLLALSAATVNSEGTVYTGTSFTANCTNPTNREQTLEEKALGQPGRALTAAEIESVHYFINDTVTSLPPPPDFHPLHTTIMPGGCQPMTVDLTRFSPNTQYYKVAVTYDTTGAVSAYSVTVPFTLTVMPPGPPVITE